MNLISKLWSCFFIWKVKPHSCLRAFDIEAILGQSFGIGKGNTPGKSNLALGQIALDVNADYQTPVILQWEIRDGVKALAPFSVIEKHQIPGEYLDTYEVIRQSSLICKEKNWKVVGILAHPDHAWRVMMVARKFGLIPYMVDTSNVPYDRKSTQPWTRSAMRFIPREILVRLYYLYKGWI